MAVIFVDTPGNRSLPPSFALKAAAGESEFISVTDIGAAIAAIESTEIVDALVTNAPDTLLCKAFRQHHPDFPIILVTDQPMSEYSDALEGDEHLLVDHVIANRTGMEWTVNELRSTLQKLLNKDIFGLEKYLAPGTVIQEATITGSENRDLHNLAVMKFAQEHKLGQHMSKTIFGISEELLMNAIYDAPVAGGSMSFDNIPRTAAVKLEPHQYATLRYGCDGNTFGIAVSDPFGALKREKLFQYLKKVLMRRDSTSLIDNKKGGAGLGIFKILYSSHALVCNVQPKRHTEFMALINVHDQLRDFSKMARSIHYFEVS